MCLRRATRAKLNIAVAGLLLLSVITGVLVFPRAGHFIVAEDRFTYAELAVVLSGDPITRALAARDLYRTGKVARILVIPEPPNRFEDELVKLGLLDPTLPPLSARILLASGVPASKIAFLPASADGTIVEAYQVQRFLAGELPQRLAVVTSKFASRRACFIFRRVLRGVEVFCSPSPYDPFNPERWWTHPRNALFVVMEYQKLLANAVQLTLGLSGS